jgi:hypothetical protein
MIEFSGINEFSEHLDINKILSGDLSGLISVLYLAIAIAIYAVIIYNFYRYIARRDCFKPSKRKHTKTIGFLKYFFLFPIVAVAFFLVFSLMLLFLSKDIRIDIVLSTSFAIILAIRITSYYTEDLSKDLAKMLPFALLGIFLVSPSFFEQGDIENKISLLPEFVNTALQFIIFLIIIEWILRILLTARYAIIPKKEEKTPVEEKAP